MRDEIEDYKLSFHISYDRSLDLYIDYTYKPGKAKYLSHVINTFLVFEFDDCESLYKLIAPLSNNRKLIKILKNDKLLINKEHKYYLNKSALLRLL